MSKLHQMNLSYVAEEDRMFFRLSTTGRSRAEYRFVLTRRYVRMLWDGLFEALKSQHEAETDLKNEVSQAAELQAAHQEAVSSANFKADYKEGHIYPLGEEPILAAQFALRPGPKGNQTLRISPKEGSGVEFDLDTQLQHRLCRLLADLATKADWNLDFDLGQAEKLIDGSGLN